METLIVKVKDDRKLNFVLELLRDLTYVEVRQAPMAREEADETGQSEAATKDARTFMDTYGIWAGRDIDAQELRRQAWQRDHTQRS